MHQQVLASKKYEMPVETAIMNMHLVVEDREMKFLIHIPIQS